MDTLRPERQKTYSEAVGLLRQAAEWTALKWEKVLASSPPEQATRSGGLGYLILDSRSAGRYDLVVAGMVIIGVIGLLLDLLVRQLEQFDEVRWGYASK